MASRSGGTIPPRQDIIDANQAIALLATVHHWAATKVNGGRAGYKVTITHAGRRVTAHRVRFIDAVIAAMQKLRERDAPKLRLAR